MNSTPSDSIHSAAANDACPPGETLRAWLSGALPTEDDAPLAQHLDRCSRCLAEADRLTSRDYWQYELRAFDSAPPTVDAGRAAGTAATSETPHFLKLPNVDASTAAFADVFPDGIAVDGDSDLLPEMSSRFRKLQPIGRGGCARVFRAEDTALGRVVALKFPNTALLTDRTAYSRFLTELRATAALHHPYIVALYDAGFVEQQGYIVFEYVPGQTLAEWISAQASPIGDRIAAAIVSRLADGVQHAHEAGILHRDLKPSNVLLDTTRTGGDLPFVPRIADFGIARFLNSDITHTLDEVVLGSPPFMSPEQALGDRSRIGPASDVYALGGILYQLLTQQLPIQGASAADTLRRVLTDDPLPPRRHRTDVQRDLEAICLKCLAKDPRERYSTARALQRDLDRFLAGESVSVRPPRLWETAIRTTRRNPAWTTLAATIATTVIVVLVLLSRYSAALGELANQLRHKNTALTVANKNLAQALIDARTAQDEARHNEARAQLNEHRARETVYAYDLRQAFQAAEKNDARMLYSLLSRYADGTELAKYRGPEWNHLWRRIQRRQRELLQTADPHYQALLSPDHSLLAVVGKDAEVRLLAWPSGVLRESWPTGQREVNGVCFSPDGNTLWTAGDDGSICCWDKISHELRYRIEAHVPHLAFEIVYDAPRHQLISCGKEGTIRIWNPDTGAAIGLLEGHARTVDTIQLHPDGRRLISPSADGTARIWDLATLSSEHLFDLRRLQAEDGSPSYVAISPDGRWLAISLIRVIIVIDLNENCIVAERRSRNEPTRLCFDDTSRRLFVGELIGVIEEWSLQTDNDGNLTWDSNHRAWPVHTANVYHLAYDAHSHELITAGRDGRVLASSCLDDLSGVDCEIRHSSIYNFRFIPGEHELLVASQNGVTLHALPAEVNSLVARQPERTLHSGEDWRHVAVSIDRRWLAAANESGGVAIWNRDGEQVVATQVYDGIGVQSMAFAPDCRHLCVAVSGAVAPKWVDLTTGHVESLPLVDRCAAVETSNDGQRLALTFEQKTRIYDWSARRWMCEVPAASPAQQTVAFLPDSRSIVVASERQIRLHDAATGLLLREFLGHNEKVSGLAVSHDGRTLVSAGGLVGVVKLWHIPTGQHLADINSDAVDISARCAFSHDDVWLAFTLNSDCIRAVRLRDADGGRNEMTNTARNQQIR